MELQSIIFLLFLPYCIAFEFECNIYGPSCGCIKGKEYEFQCPSIHQCDVLIHATPNIQMKMDCINLTRYDVKVLPQFQAGRLQEFTMRRCPLDYNDLQSTLNHFNVTSVTAMKLDELWMTDNVNVRNITKDFFQGFEALQELYLMSLRITVEDDFLEYLPNLERLYVENIVIENMSGMFKYTTKLTVLHLSINNISNIPDGAFQTLSNLKQLHVRNNNLRTLRKEYFTGLTKLNSLELSANMLEVLDADVFSGLPNLVTINLSRNKLTKLSGNLFEHNPKLESIRVGYHPKVILPDRLIANLTKLTYLNIDNSNLESLPVNFFFFGCDNLKQLTLKNNKLVKIPDVFAPLNKIEELNLENNEISELTEYAFAGATSLKKLILKNNRIKNIHHNSFPERSTLVELDISYNLYSKYHQSTFPVELEILNICHNLLNAFPDDIVRNENRLKKLDLSYNKIEYIDVETLFHPQGPLTIDLSSNNITKVDFLKTKLPDTVEFARNKDVDRTKVILAGNQLICDCNVYDLVLYASGNLTSVINAVDLELYEARCKEMEGAPITDLRPEQITCPDEDDCPDHCSCSYRPSDMTSVIDCRYKGLLTCPVIRKKSRKVEVNLVGNHIEFGPNKSMGYDNVTNLFLSKNRIQRFDWVPPKIQTLSLDGNNINGLPSNTIKALNGSVHLKKLELSSNPWSCGCSALELQNFLRTNFKKVNITAVICKEDNKLLTDKQQLCVTAGMLVLKIVLPICIILLLTVITYLKFKRYIKVWLFSKNLCLRFIREEEVDKDKKYDVFVSYAHQDEDFVIRKLLPVLESGLKPFDVCIHVRDWNPGELIETQVSRSVLQSRRTLVVLSNHFLESVWGKLEFRTAHVTAIKDNCPRLIVIKYGDLDEKKLDEDLKLYLKTNTYIEWGSRWFWKQLLFSLPHKKSDRYQESLKHANIMLKIDEKFELGSVPVADPESTPPVLAMDQSKLKNNALNFIASESPLIT